MPIAIAPMAGENLQPQAVSEVVSADLARTGLFRLVNTAGISPLPTEPSEVNFADWAGRSAEALVIGKIEPAPEGRVEVRFRLFDVQKQSQLASFSYVVAPVQLRATAHRIADVIYEKLTGDKGVFSTKITYVVKRGTRYELQVSDADGFNAQSVLASNEPIMSPAWSPDGSRLAYVSFDQKKPIVVVQNLAQGTTRVIAAFRGNNSAPAWSPDSRFLLVALSKDGLTQIYRISSSGGEPTRLTDSPGHRHPAGVLARWAMDRLHLRSRRLAADLQDARGGRPGPAPYVRWQLQRGTALQPRRQDARVRAARWRPLSHRVAGARDRAGDHPHRRHPRRFTHLRAQR